MNTLTLIDIQVDINAVDYNIIRYSEICIFLVKERSYNKAEIPF